MSIRPTAQRPHRDDTLSAKQEILARLRTALAAEGQSAPQQYEDIPRAYQRADDKQETTTDPAKVRDLLVKRLDEYTARVHSTTPEELPRTIAAAVEGADRVGVPRGLPGAWREAIGGEIVVDSPEDTPRDLDALDAVVTGCHTAIALTGTIVLRSDELCGRRALTLVPDHHVVVVQADQVVLGVPAGIERLAEDAPGAWTMVSGPSATSDIELERVEGVHGPRRLDVIFVEPSSAQTD